MTAVVYHPDIIDLSWLALTMDGASLTWREYIQNITQVGVKREKKLTFSLYNDQYSLTVLPKKEIGFVFPLPLLINKIIVLAWQYLLAANTSPYLIKSIESGPEDNPSLLTSLFDIDIATENYFGQYTSDSLLQESKYFFSIIKNNSNKSTIPLIWKNEFIDYPVALFDTVSTFIKSNLTDLSFLSKYYNEQVTYSVKHIFAIFDYSLYDSIGTLVSFSKLEERFTDSGAVYYGTFAPDEIITTINLTTYLDQSVDLLRSHENRQFYQFSTLVVPLGTVDPSGEDEVSITIFGQTAFGAFFPNNPTLITGDMPSFTGSRSLLDGRGFAIIIERQYSSEQEGNLAPYLIEGVLYSSTSGLFNLFKVATNPAMQNIYRYTIPSTVQAVYREPQTDGFFHSDDPFKITVVDAIGNGSSPAIKVQADGSTSSATLTPSSTVVREQSSRLVTGFFSFSFSYQGNSFDTSGDYTSFSVDGGSNDDTGPHITVNALSHVTDAEKQVTFGGGGVLSFQGSQRSANPHNLHWGCHETIFGDTFIKHSIGESRNAESNNENTLKETLMIASGPTSFSELLALNTYLTDQTGEDIPGGGANNFQYYIQTNNVPGQSQNPEVRTNYFYDISVLYYGSSPPYGTCYFNISANDSVAISGWNTDDGSYDGIHTDYIHSKYAEEPNDWGFSNIALPSITDDRNHLPLTSDNSLFTFRCIYLVDTNFNKIGFCYFTISAAILSLLISYIDNLTAITSLVSILNNIPRTDWSASDLALLEASKLTRELLDAYFIDANMPFNDFMSYSLMHFILARVSRSAVIYIVKGV